MFVTSGRLLPEVAMTAGDLRIARATRGFMPDEEGLLLHRAGLAAAPRGAMLEVGSYCGKSAVYLGTAARQQDSVLFSIDHHRGSEENQPGQLYFDPALLDPATGLIDTLPHFRRTIAEAGLESWVIPVVSASAAVSARWRTPLSLLFIDGGHTEAAAHADYEGFAPWLTARGLLVIHDVFSDPADGGQAPFHVFERARRDGYVDLADAGSMRVLIR